VVATAGGNRLTSPRRSSPRHRPLKAKTRARIPPEPPPFWRLACCAFRVARS